MTILRDLFRRPVGVTFAAGLAAIAILVSGCTIHPRGEAAERAAAKRAGQSFQRSVEQRHLPPLPDNPTPDQLVDYAPQANADLEAKYWQWRAAIEQIPQDGTQATNLAISGSTSVLRGRAALDRTTISAGNDPMADIVLPSKLSAAARRALENARAAGLRFRKAQLDLRAKVLNAWYDYALTAEMIRLEETNRQLLTTTAMVVEARNRAGSAGQQELLKARNEIDLSANDLANLQSQLPAQRAALNALLSRDARAPIAAPSQLPPPTPLAGSDDEFLRQAAASNPELAAQLREVDARQREIELARLQRLPDFSLNAGTDLKGLSQSILAMITVPAFRHEAIDAAVAQAQANLRAAEAMRRQTHNDLASQVIMDLATVRDADVQLQLLEKTILPRAEQAIDLIRTAYETGHTSLLDLLDSQRSLISIRRLVLNLNVVRGRRLVDLEAITGKELPTTQQEQK